MRKSTGTFLLLLFLYASYLQGVQPQPFFKLFSGSTNQDLANAVANYLDVPLDPIKLGRFHDGEIRIQIEENIRNCDVFIIQSICPTSKESVNDSLIELYLMIRAMKRASADRIHVVIPYYGYARQDRKMEGRVPISASDVAMLLELAGADHVIAVDLHCGQIQGFFHEAPVDNLFASNILVPYFAEKNDLQNLVIVSPDAGGVPRAKTFIEELDHFGKKAELAIIIKQRAEAGVVETMRLVGNVAGCDVVIVDDICDTAGTLVKAAQELKNQGARRVFACITHPLFSGQALSKIAESAIEELIVADTIPLRTTLPPNVKQISIAPLVAESIMRTHQGESISDLFITRKY
jgi:ribose-phosphate pyrophosphokinase